MKKQVIWDIQDALHNNINKFMNGSNMTKSAKMFYPHYQRINNDFVSITHLLKQAEGCFFSEINKKQNETISEKDFAVKLCRFYNEFYSQVGRMSKNKAKSIKCKETYNLWRKKTDKNNKAIQNIENLRKILAEDLVYDFILHGSYGTLDYTAWSDIDAIVILCDDIFKDPKKLLLLRKKIVNLQILLLDTDPLHHHGLFIVTKKQMDRYPQSYLPFVVYENGISMFNRKENMIFCERPSSTLNQIREAIKFLDSIHKKIDKHTQISASEWKSYFSTVLFLPCLYLQYAKKPYYKRDAIREIKTYFSSNAWEAVVEATEVRNKWNYTNKKTIKLWNVFVSRYLTKKTVKIVRIDQQKIKEKTTVFISELENKIEK